ncbi:hypothetical protein L9F63_014726, partial [Diploptera punctata]
SQLSYLSGSFLPLIHRYSSENFVTILFEGSMIHFSWLFYILPDSISTLLGLGPGGEVAVLGDHYFNRLSSKCWRFSSFSLFLVNRKYFVFVLPEYHYILCILFRLKTIYDLFLILSVIIIYYL